MLSVLDLHGRLPGLCIPVLIKEMLDIQISFLPLILLFIIKVDI